MKAQEIFNKVVKHLRKQGHRAYDPIQGLCRYRTEDGSRCAVGCLIPKRHYKPAFEGESVDPSCSRNDGEQAKFDLLWTALRKVGITKRHGDLLARLQTAHDDGYGYDDGYTVWEENWKQIAKDFNLEMPS